MKQSKRVVAANSDRDRLLGRQPDEATIQSGIEALLSSIQSEFEFKVDLRKKKQQFLRALDKQVGGKEIEAAVAGLKRVDIEMRKRLSDRKAKTTDRVRAAPRLTAAHIPVTAPFPNDWAPTPNLNGSPPVASNYADKSTGKMGFDIWTLGTNSSADCSAGIGTFFVPSSDGILRVSSDPTITFDWTLTSMFSGSHSEAQICLFVKSFLLDGTPDQVLVNQRNPLWSHDNTGNDHGVRDYSLSAEITVNSQRQYLVMVWCNGEAGDGGSSAFSYANGHSQVDVVVPEITLDIL
jgi:hypothetical protein